MCEGFPVQELNHASGNIAGYQGTYTNAETVVDEYKGTLDNGGETNNESE